MQPRYQPTQALTIRALARAACSAILSLTCATALVLFSLGAAAAKTAAAAPRLAPSPTSAKSDTLSGFAPAPQHLLTPILRVAPAGPRRSARALALFDRALALERKLLFHPIIAPNLQELIAKLPPRQSTLIRAASLYSRTDIGWSLQPPDVHYVAVSGRPSADEYLYSWAPRLERPAEPGALAGAFALRPAEPLDGSAGRSAICDLDEQISLDTFGAGAIVDFGTAMLTEVYGDLAPPWDSAPGAFNQHDSAALARFARDFPAFAERVGHYLIMNNVVDELADRDGPFVLFNLDASVREEALAPFPHLRAFYRSVAPLVDAEVIVEDGHRHQWIHSSFEHGRIRVVFLVRAGMLTPMDARFAPAGDPVPLDRLDSGHYRCVGSVRIHRMGMDFGLDTVSFDSDFRRSQDDLHLVSHMSATPVIIAPPVIHGLITMIAGRFLHTLANGDGGHGLAATFSSNRRDGNVLMEFDARGEFLYSPALELLARVGDAIADVHNQAVREDERRLGEQLFDAFIKDYDNARPALLALDRDDTDR